MFATDRERVEAVRRYIDDMFYGLKTFTLMFGSFETIELQYLRLLELLFLLDRPQEDEVRPRFIMDLYTHFLQKKFPHSNQFLSGHIDSVDKLIELLEEFEKEVRAEIAR